MQKHSSRHKIILMSIADPGRILREPETGDWATTAGSVYLDDVRTAANRLRSAISPPILAHRKVSMANQLPAAIPIATILVVIWELPISNASQRPFQQFFLSALVFRIGLFKLDYKTRYKTV